MGHSGKGLDLGLAKSFPVGRGITRVLAQTGTNGRPLPDGTIDVGFGGAEARF